MAAASSKKKFGDMKWGDADNDYEDTKEQSSSSSSSSSSLISPAQPTQLKPGIHTVEEVVYNDEKKKVKIIRKVKVSMKEVKVNKNVLRRRQLKKFGDASRAPPGPEENITYLSNEIIHLDLKPKRRGEEKEEGLSSLDKLQNSQFRCRNCGELGHWTLKCPKRSEIKPVGISEIKEEGGSGGDSGKYVPPSMRNRGVRGLGATSDRNDDSLSVRVTNLSEDVTEQDLHELVRRFGNTSRIFLAKDRNTQKSRGFAFISFYDRSSAEACINKLNGHGYDNLILHVEWAKPREMDAPTTNKDASKSNGGKF